MCLFREEIWSLQVDDSVSSICCDDTGNIVATLASGSIAVAQVFKGYISDKIFIFLLRNFCRTKDAEK